MYFEQGNRHFILNLQHRDMLSDILRNSVIDVGIENVQTSWRQFTGQNKDSILFIWVIVIAWALFFTRTDEQTDQMLWSIQLSIQVAQVSTVFWFWTLPKWPETHPA